MRLYNATDSAVINYGVSQHTGTTHTAGLLCSGMSVFTLGGSKAMEIQARCSQSFTNYGFGVPMNEDSGAVAIYTTVEIRKHS